MEIPFCCGYGHGDMPRPGTPPRRGAAECGTTVTTEGRYMRPAGALLVGGEDASHTAPAYGVGCKTALALRRRNIASIGSNANPGPQWCPELWTEPSETFCQAVKRSPASAN